MLFSTGTRLSAISFLSQLLHLLSFCLVQYSPMLLLGPEFAQQNCPAAFPLLPLTSCKNFNTLKNIFLPVGREVRFLCCCLLVLNNPRSCSTAEGPILKEGLETLVVGSCWGWGRDAERFRRHLGSAGAAQQQRQQCRGSCEPLSPAPGTGEAKP